LVTSVASIKKPSTVTKCAGFSLGIANRSELLAPFKNVFVSTQTMPSGGLVFKDFFASLVHEDVQYKQNKTTLIFE
jgi:hypothetical protein